MDSAKLVTLLLLSCSLTVNCGPIKRRQSWHSLGYSSDCGSAHLAPLPTIIAERAAFSSIPIRYAEPLPIAKASPAFGYEFTVPVPPSLPPTFKAACAHTIPSTAPEIAHIPPPLPPPAAFPTNCLDAPHVELAPIPELPPPPPPTELQLPTPVHTEPCFDTAPAHAPILAAPAPILTEPIALPPPPPTHVITEPLKTPGCFETAPAAPAFVDAPLPPADIQFAPLPPHVTFTEPSHAFDCHGATHGAAFTFHSQPLESLHYGSPIAAGEEYPEILEARSAFAKTGISHRLIAPLAKH